MPLLYTKYFDIWVVSYKFINQDEISSAVLSPFQNQWLDNQIIEDIQLCRQKRGHGQAHKILYSDFQYSMTILYTNKRVELNDWPKKKFITGPILNWMDNGQCSCGYFEPELYDDDTMMMVW